MILSMKACARAGKNRGQSNRERETANADFLMDVIVKWAIIEYYRDA